MELGYSRKAAEERAARESSYQHPTAMGAAALGELTGERAAPDEAQLTALAHARSDAIREALGLPERAKFKGLTDKQLVEAARAAVQADPEYPERLIAELERKPRPTDSVETAVLLRHESMLENLLYQTETPRPDGTVDAESARQLKQEIQRVRGVTDPIGSEAGHAFRVRQALMDSDYSIVGLLRRAEKAKGAPLTTEERAEIHDLHEKLQKAQEELEALRAKGPDEGRVPGRPSDAEVTVKERKNKITGMIDRIEDENKPWWAKAMDKALDVQRFSILSGPQTVIKLGGAAISRVVLAPVRQAVAAGLGKLPLVRQVAAESPRWGRLSRKAEIDALTTGLVTGLKAARERSPFGPGQSAADVAYGDKSGRKEGKFNRVLAAPGEAHGSLKAVPFESEFARSAQMRVEFYRKRGMATDTVAAQEKIGREAYRDAEEATFQKGAGDAVTDWFNSLIAKGKAKDQYGNYRFLPYAGATLVKSQAPIVRVPLNIIGESLRGLFGTLTGSVGVADAIARGVKDLPPDRADLIMKRLADGSIGATFVALGALGYAHMGGLHVSGDRRKKDIGEGEAEVFGVTLPKEVLHDPRLQLMQAGATAVQQAERYVKGEPMGLLGGTGAAFGATLSEVPFVRDIQLAERLLKPAGQGSATAEMLKSFALPQLVQWVARQLDKPHPFSPTEEPVKRQHKGFVPTMQYGTPVLREQLPVAP